MYYLSSGFHSDSGGMLMSICGQAGQNSARPPSTGTSGRSCTTPALMRLCKSRHCRETRRSSRYRFCIALSETRKVIRSVGKRTGTFDGNASLVTRWILVMKFIAAVLHSNASIRKWSKTSNVNAVFGFLKLAGKSFDRRRS